MSDKSWFKSRESGKITHYCGGVEYKDSLEGGTNKMKETQTALTPWFYPVQTLDNGALKCTMCSTEVQMDAINFVLF